MTLIKILGIGSSFGEDQAGLKVVEILKEMSAQSNISRYADIVSCDRPGVRLIELISNVRVAFLVDAVVTGSHIGKIYRLQNDEIYTIQNTLSTHHIGVIEALQIGQVLGELPETIIFYGIEIGHIDFQSPIDEAVQQSILQVALLLNEEVRSMASPPR